MRPLLVPLLWRARAAGTPMPHGGAQRRDLGQERGWGGGGDGGTRQRPHGVTAEPSAHTQPTTPWLALHLLSFAPSRVAALCIGVARGGGRDWHLV